MKQGHLEDIKLLLECGAAVNIETKVCIEWLINFMGHDITEMSINIVHESMTHAHIVRVD